MYKKDSPVLFVEGTVLRIDIEERLAPVLLFCMVAAVIMGDAPCVKAARLFALSGLFPIYKPQGPTSAQLLNQLKGKLLAEAGIKHEGMKRKQQKLKLGHGGTLDSAASGVLVVGIGKGTKMLSSMLTGSKKYTTVGELGKATDTLDALGKVTEEKPYDHITRADMEGVLQKFFGEIMQVPPLYSALKKDGERLSCLMKKGAKVEAKPARPVTVYNICLKAFQPPLFTLDVECGGGFYIRSLVNDIGKELSSCASVKELIRTKQGQFTEENTVPEENWTIDCIARVLEHGTPSTATEPCAKKCKTQDSNTEAEVGKVE